MPCVNPFKKTTPGSSIEMESYVTGIKGLWPGVPEISQCKSCIHIGLVVNLVITKSKIFQRIGCPSYLEFSHKSFKLLLSRDNNQ